NKECQRPQIFRDNFRLGQLCYSFESPPNKNDEERGAGKPQVQKNLEIAVMRVGGGPADVVLDGKGFQRGSAPKAGESVAKEGSGKNHRTYGAPKIGAPGEILGPPHQVSEYAGIHAEEDEADHESGSEEHDRGKWNAITAMKFLEEPDDDHCPANGDDRSDGMGQDEQATK